MTPEERVRKALSATDPSIARVLERHPGAVLATDSERGRALNWTTPSPNKVFVFTEYGIGDPFQYDHVYQAFDAAVAALERDTGVDWIWESINPAVHVFYIDDRGKVVNPAGNVGAKVIVPKGTRMQSGRDLSADRARSVRRKNPSGEDLQLAKDKYKEFHRYEAVKIGEFAPGFAIPSEVLPVGVAKWVTYRSAKVDPATLKKPRSPVNYIHEHDAGVVVYVPESDATWDLIDRLPFRDDECLVEVPREFREVEALTCLGKSLGYCAIVEGEEIEAETTEPLPELYCVPSGKCLLIIQDKREVLAMIWGGALGVFARGIDG